MTIELKKRLRILVAPMIALILLAVVITIGLFYSSGGTQRINFETYAPSYLPKGYIMQKPTFNILYEFPHKLSSNLYITLNSDGSYIGEALLKQTEAPLCDNVENVMCTKHKTKNHIKYTLETTTWSKGNLQQRVSFTFNDTLIWVEFKNLNQSFDDTELSKIIDSFKPKTFNGVSTVRQPTGP